MTRRNGKTQSARPQPDETTTMIKSAPKRNRTRRDIRGVAHIVLLAVALAWCATASARILDDRLLFTNTGQSQWTSGAAAEFNTHGPQFVGVSAPKLGDSIGEIDEECILGICERTGFKVGLTGNVRAGLNYDVTISSGSLSITLPQHVTYSVPDAFAVKQGGVFNIVTKLVPTTTYLIYPDRISATGHIGPTVVKPSLQTTGPTAQLLVSSELGAGFQAIAQACFVVYCLGPNLELGIPPTSQELLAVNHNGDRQIRVLGNVVANAQTAHSFDDGNVVVTAQLPTLNTDSRQRVAGFDLLSGDLNSGNRANIATLTARLDKLASDLLGLPPLNGKSGSFGYNLLTADGGLNIDVKQEFTFDPDLRGALNFTSPVIVGNGGIFNSANATNHVDFHVGDTLSLRSNFALSLGVAPEYTLDNQTRNQTGLQVDGSLKVSAIGADAFGITIGPLLREEATGGIGYIPLFDNTFRVNTPTVKTTPFNIEFSNTRDSINADLGCLASVIDTCDRHGLFSFNPTLCADFFDGCADGARDVGDQIYQVNNFYDLLDKSADGNDCVRFDANGRPCNNRFAFEQILPELIALGDTLHLGTTSRLGFDDDGNRVYFSDSLAAVQANAPELLVTNDTDEGSTQRLATLGFTNEFAPFDIPPGAPRPVPEPVSLLMLLAGIAGVVALRTRASIFNRRI